MTSTDVARDKAARLLKKRGSISSSASNEFGLKHHRKHGEEEEVSGGHKQPEVNTIPETITRSVNSSMISFMDEPSHDDYRPPVRMENTYQLGPNKKFPTSHVKDIIKDVLEGYLCEEKYEPELCRQMTKTVSEVIKARVKDLMLPRYKIICLVHIGQLSNQSMRVGSRCLWDPSSDTFSTFEYRNNSLFAIGTVYGIYSE